MRERLAAWKELRDIVARENGAGDRPRFAPDPAWTAAGVRRGALSPVRKPRLWRRQQPRAERAGGALGGRHVRGSGRRAVPGAGPLPAEPPQIAVSLGVGETRKSACRTRSRRSCCAFWPPPGSNCVSIKEPAGRKPRAWKGGGKGRGEVSFWKDLSPGSPPSWPRAAYTWVTFGGQHAAAARESRSFVSLPVSLRRACSSAGCPVVHATVIFVLTVRICGRCWTRCVWRSTHGERGKLKKRPSPARNPPVIDPSPRPRRCRCYGRVRRRRGRNAGAAHRGAARGPGRRRRSRRNSWSR